jgi:hypothetical protein
MKDLGIIKNKERKLVWHLWTGKIQIDGEYQTLKEAKNAKKIIMGNKKGDIKVKRKLIKI